MVTRPTLNDLAAAAGVSIATVDRVINRRLPVSDDTVQRVVQAAERIGYHATGLLKRRLVEAPMRRFGFILQKRRDYFYHALGDKLALETTQSRAIQGRAIVDYVDELSAQAIVDHLKVMAPKVDAMGIVAVEHPLVVEAVEQLAKSGKPVVTLISDINASQRACYVAVDSRKRGRTAAWAIARMSKGPGKVGILVGTHGYLSQETVEMSFRSYLREHAPDLQVLEPIFSLDDGALAYGGVKRLMSEVPDLIGVFSLGGGQEGLVRALRQDRGSRELVVVCNELTPETRAALIEGWLTMALGTPIDAIAAKAIEMMTIATGAKGGSVLPQVLFPADIHISETI
jgi:LacI family transcriptional regulator